MIQHEKSRSDPSKTIIEVLEDMMTAYKARGGLPNISSAYCLAPKCSASISTAGERTVYVPHAVSNDVSSSTGGRCGNTSTCIQNMYNNAVGITTVSPEQNCHLNPVGGTPPETTPVITDPALIPVSYTHLTAADE